MLLVHETIRREPTESLTLRDQDLPDFTCPYHRHPEFEIVRIDESCGRVLVGDWAGRFQPGDLFVFGGKLPHAFINDQETRRARSRCLQFRPELLTVTSKGWPEMQPLEDLLQWARRGIRLSGSASQLLSNRLDAVSATRGVQQIGELMLLWGAMLDTEAEEMLASEHYDLDCSDRQILRLESVLNHIHAHAAESLTIEALAQLAGMSVSAFHRCFRERMGCAPGAYLLDVRFANIAHRLLESEDSVTEIAYSSGFNNISNFNRQFLQRFACSPRDYRKKMNASSVKNDA